MTQTSTARSRSVLCVLLLGLLLGGPFASIAGAQFYGNKPTGSPTHTPPEKVLNDVRIEQNLGAELPLGLRFRDETGRDVTLGEYFDDGRPVVLVLAYYECPMLCTQVLNGLVTSLKLVKFDMGEDYRVITVSIDPGETPQMAAATKKTYVEQYARGGSAADGWHFLVGDTAAVAELSKVTGFHAVYDSTSGEYAHASAIMLATPDGTLSRYFYGIDYSAVEVQMGLIEAAEGDIGSPANAIVFLCYEYDPTTGKYGLMVTRVMQLAGAATVLLLGGFMTFWLRRERRRTAQAMADDDDASAAVPGS